MRNIKMISERIGSIPTPDAKKLDYNFKVGIVPHDNVMFPTILDEVSKAYAMFSRKPLASEQIRSDLNDPYDQERRSYWLMVTSTGNSMDNSSIDVAGMVRVVTGEDSESLLPLDAMNYVQGTWPHDLDNAPVQQIAEYGRFTIPERWRTKDLKEAGITKIITQSLYFETIQMIKELNINYLYAIMPRHVVDFIQDAGIKVQELSNLTINPTNEKFRLVMEKFDIYWYCLDPRVFRFVLDEK